MFTRIRLAAALVGLSLLASTLQAADVSASLQKGTPDLKSVGQLAAGPEGILFVADPNAGAIFAIDTSESAGPAAPGKIEVKGIGDKIASLLGTEASALQIADLVVGQGGNAYLAVMRGRGPDAAPVLLRVNSSGKIEAVNLKDVKFAKVTLPNANTTPPRGRPGPSQAITDLIFVDGKVFVAGLSNEAFASTLRVIPFPFPADGGKGTGIEIYHGNHGAFETRAPIRAFTAYKIDGDDHLLGAYTCTPLAKFPVKDLKPGEKVRGTTIAELGNRNTPLDMIVYQKGGKDYILMANDNRGLMKFATEGLGKVEGITTRIGGKAGLGYETLETFKNDVVQLDRLGKDQALILRKVGDGYDLETIALP
jgi:hypothetical protein